ncbi:MAG: MazG family protein, partial [Frankia sp.]|nr:MazG family protein [Frankia sp.]
VPVCCADAGHRQLPALRAAGVDVRVLPLPNPAAAAAGAVLAELRAAVEASPAGPSGRPEVVWLLEPAGGWSGRQAVVDAALRELAEAGELVTRELAGTADVPGALLLDAVAVMDRLRSPGGCPWDAEQTHASLAPYLLEETYEAYQAIEDGDLAELREELGDVLLQVLFHSRLAQEHEPGAGRFDIDAVAAGLVAKLVRRHPHVFGEVAVAGAEQVVSNWEAIKAAEKGRRSVTEGVPLSQPALTLAAKLQKRAARIGVPADLVLPAAAEPAVAAEGPAGSRAVAEPGDGQAPDPAVARAAAAAAAARAAPGAPDHDRVGDLLFAAVALAAAAGVDPEAALRARARAFRDRLAAAEDAALADGAEPAELDPAGWRERWS